MRKFLLQIIVSIGRKFIFYYEVIKTITTKPLQYKNLLSAIIEIGFFSLPLVGMTAIFTGAVLALQTYSGFSRFSAESSVAAVVSMSMVREIGPVIGALMIAGRVGASIAAEISSMVVSEQVDALKIMAVDIYRYLFAPRVIAGLIMLPILVFIIDVIGFYGGYLVAILRLGFDETRYIANSINILQGRDFALGFAKSIIFGFFITANGCYYSYKCGNSAKGIGLATTKALVNSATSILVSNYIITELFFIYDF